LAPTVNSGEVDVEALILEAIGKKHGKGGAAYASGKTLIVFLNAKIASTPLTSTHA
jgi:hypothetical protein